MKGRIPRTLADFDSYIRTVIAFLQATSGASTNGERLGLTTGEVAAAAAYLTQWYTGVPASPGAYEKHTNPATKSKATRLAVLNIMKNFRLLFSPFLTRMSGSAAIPDADRLVLRIASPVTTHRTPQTPIKDDIFALVKAAGGGNISIMCRSDHDASRGSLAADADGVEVAWSVGAAPATPDNAQFKLTFSKSKFIIAGGLANSGKKIYIYVRWINSKHPEIAGDWSTEYSVMIM